MKVDELFESSNDKITKITRSTFLYLSPKIDEDFAQCATCRLYLPGKERCAILGPNVHVPPEASCGFYIPGEPNDDQDCESAVKVTEAGLVRRQVRCENCKWGGKPKCSLYVLLNKTHPGICEIEEEIEPKACCNAFTGKD